ncbi:MAG: hypothetical protein HYU52_09325, partial [Acidobacteria bacterium]|nr:hypothetical protein [Acidobacteriota bacterium]
RGWVFSSGEALPSVHGSGEIAGGWFMWALRDAVAGAGFYSDGRKASAFYDRLAAEVLEACRAGRLDCSEPVLPFVTGLNRETIRPIALSLLRSIRFMALYERFDPIVPPSTGNEFSQTKFRLLTGSRPAPLDGEGGQEGVRTSIMRIAGVAYRFLTPVLLVASLPAWMFVLARRRPWRSPSAELALAASALVAMVSSVAIVALIEATSFPAITIRYLHAGYPMLIVFLVSTCEALIGSCVSRE